MPSRQLSTSTDTPPRHHHHHHFFIPLITATVSTFTLLLFLLFLLCHRILTRKRATRSPPPPSSSSPPHRLSFSVLRRATNSFSSRLGHGGFGPVFAGALAGVPVAVKLMDSTSSQQGEREFHNELFFASKLLSRHVITATHFSSDPKRRRFLLVYELMQNGNLQDALLHRKCPELANWNTRFSIILNIAKGIHFLHSCDPPVIHGDIKPSNVLLDRDFSPRIGDFGLARLSSEPPRFEIDVLECGSVNNDEEKKKMKEEEVDDCGSVASTHSVFMEEGSLGVEQSPSPETAVMMAMASPETGLAVAAASPGFELRQIGMQGLKKPTYAHLLNTRVHKLHAKVEFLQELGFTYEEAQKVCVRLPAIFRYDVENNLWPKYVYLVKEMERDLEELKKFPQYFGFSLKERIMPRHLHLKERGVRIPLNRMLMWGDEKFYKKWK